MERDDLQSALDKYTASLARQPHDPDLLYNRAVVHMQLDRPEEAIADLDRALAIRPDDPQALVNKSAMHQVLGELDSAASCLREAEVLDPTLALPPLHLGNVEMDRGHFGGAVEAYSRAIALSPGAPALYMRRAIAKRAFGDQAGAGEDCDRTLRLGMIMEPIRLINAGLRLWPTLSTAERAEMTTGLGELEAMLPLSGFERPLLSQDCQPIQVREDRRRYAPPLQGLRLKGRQVVRQEKELQSLAVNFAFPAFFGRASLTGREDPEPELPVGVTMPLLEDKLFRRQFLRRRYSGDSHEKLERRRYFALVGPRAGIASYALASEMNAYTITHKTGLCIAAQNGSEDSINLVFRGLPGEPNPLHLFVHNPQDYGSLFDHVHDDPRGSITAEIAAIVPSSTEFILSVPVADQTLEFQYCLDLRRHAAREWMLAFFSNPPPCETDEDLAHGDWLRATADEYGFERGTITDWKSFWRITSDPGFGGNGMTDVFAAFLRKLGCDGLVYPSARCDYGAVYNDGELVDWWGWNIVDYRLAALPTRLAIEENEPLPDLQDVWLTADVIEGSHRDSLAVLGNSMFNRAMASDLLDAYCKIHGRTWQHEHGDDSLAVRGFSWFMHEFLPDNRSSEHLTCAQCEGSVPASERLRAECPHCGFQGDLGPYVQRPNFIDEHF
jgi:tetratricopeptide (TPR) repeat protein